MLIGIRQLDETVGKFEITVKHFEAICTVRVIGTSSRERRLALRIVKNHGEPIRREIRHNPFRENEIEPGIAIITDRTLKIRAGIHTSCQLRCIRFARIQLYSFSKSIVITLECGCRFELRTIERRCQEFNRVPHDLLKPEIKPVPFHESKFRQVTGSALAVAKHLADLVDVAKTGGEQLLHPVFGRGVKE